MKIFGREIHVLRRRFKQISVYPVFRLISLILMVVTAINGFYVTCLLFLFIFLLTYLFKFFRKRFSLKYPEFFDVILIIFVLIALYLGEIWSFYERFWWFDMLLHFFSGIMIGSWVFMEIYNHFKNDIFSKIGIRFTAIIVFAITLAIDAIWEIFEFLMDFYFNFHLQDDLLDTMGDLLADVTGAAIVFLAIYIYLKKKKKKQDII